MTLLKKKCIFTVLFLVSKNKFKLYIFVVSADKYVVVMQNTLRFSIVHTYLLLILYSKASNNGENTTCS